MPGPMTGPGELTWCGGQAAGTSYGIHWRGFRDMAAKCRFRRLKAVPEATTW